MKALFTMFLVLLAGWLTWKCPGSDHTADGVIALIGLAWGAAWFRHVCRTSDWFDEDAD